MAVAVLVDRTALAADADVGPRQRLIDLMDRYEAPLCNYLQVMLADSESAFDCAQDTFLRAFEHLERGRAINSQWLYKVARNRAIDHIRHRGRFEQDPNQLDQIPVGDRSPSARQLRARDALALLPIADRELLYLAVIDRFPTEEIGAMLGIRSGAVRVRLHRARERFRAIYGSSI